ncbi:GAF and ANTAR domain-containing protein [Actinoplanes teichomyceticus]|uniref:GAF domain-containing protein n=1 Tax=Actinoplanes teichomyceticus TaxID=1867 RepID=A0A561WBE5_ACTTI|nr:GAF and ANTAR domain-containing protein [Actinoplanes teichomyceticus]TWG21181.1 GAF domain-containing protein [Actinoplanes teichomyceticus]
MAPPQPAADPGGAHRQPLAEAVVALVEHPEGAGDRLTRIAQLAVERVAAADYASITTLHGDAYTTVTASDDIVRAVDEAQIADRSGPCLQALRTGEPVTVPDTGATMQWPGFHRIAPALGLVASVSVPLHTGCGPPEAVLNLYGRDSTAMTPLILGLDGAHGTQRDPDPALERLLQRDPGAAELLTGYAEALAARATIRLAVRVLARDTNSTDDDAYRVLRACAADEHTPLSAAAAAVLTGQR